MLTSKSLKKFRIAFMDKSRKGFEGEMVTTMSDPKLSHIKKLFTEVSGEIEEEFSSFSIIEEKKVTYYFEVADLIDISKKTVEK